MKVLIFGPSGSGKTFVSKMLKDEGINAFDGDDIAGLSAWYDRDGRKVAEPKTAGEAMANRYSFLWSKKFLAGFLERFSDVYIFGGSGNIANVFDLFDKVYFLKIDPELQKERLLNGSRPNPLMDKNEDSVVVWGEWLEEFAKKHNIPFIDASQTPQQIFEVISQ
jgi:adenylate kinase family enzyme